MKLDAASNNASVVFKHEYRQYEPDPIQGDIDREMDATRDAARAVGIPDDEDEPADPYSLYQLYDQMHDRYYRMKPIDVGWADYLNKELHHAGPNSIPAQSGGQGRVYVQRELTKEANALHTEARGDYLHRQQQLQQERKS